MSFRVCLLVSCVAFAVICVASMPERSSLDAFDAGSAAETGGSRQQAAPPERHIALRPSFAEAQLPVPQQPSSSAEAAPPSAERPPSPQPRASAGPRDVEAKQPNQLDTTSRPTTEQQHSPESGAAEMVPPIELADIANLLDLSLDERIQTNDLAALLRRHQSFIMAVRLHDSVVQEAIIVDGQPRSRRLAGPQFQPEFEKLLGDFPTSTCLYFRWRASQGAVADLAVRQLAQFNLPLDDYQLFLVLGPALSREIQQAVTRAFNGELPSADQRKYVNVVLVASGGRLTPQVQDAASLEAVTSPTSADGTAPNTDM